MFSGELIRLDYILVHKTTDSLLENGKSICKQTILEEDVSSVENIKISNLPLIKAVMPP